MCQEKLTQMCQNEFPKEFENIQTIPGIKEHSATSILAEIGADMKMFITASALGHGAASNPEMKKVQEISNRVESRMVTSISEKQ